MNRLAFVPLLVAVTAHAQPPLGPQPTLTPEAAAAVGDGRYVSFQTEDEKTAPDYTLHVVKLSKAGHSLVSSIPVKYDGKQTWVDARTLALVVVDTEKKTYTLQYLVDGVVDPKRTIAGPLQWKLPKGMEAPTTTWGFRGTKGELYLRTCVAEDTGETECPKPTWMRIDGAKPGPVKAPKGVVSFGATGAKDPSVKAPKDITVKLTKVASKLEKKKIPAIACTKGGATTTWSYESMEGSAELFFPKSTSWVMLDPPIYSATGKHSNPVGWESIVTYYFRACDAREMESFEWLGGGLWMEHSYSDLSIKIHAGNDPVAVFKGVELHAAPVAQPPASGDKR